jgi:hypothetical protein
LLDCPVVSNENDHELSKPDVEKTDAHSTNLEEWLSNLMLIFFKVQPVLYQNSSSQTDAKTCIRTNKE